MLAYIINAIYLQIITSKYHGENNMNIKPSIRFLQLADWGGQDEYPYYNPSQLATSLQMGNVSDITSPQFVLALGDNFYKSGIEGSYESPRFEETWNSVYTSKSLQVNWYVCAGNHDHRGNVFAQIEYSKHSSRWTFPSYYYKRSFYSLDGSLKLDLIMMDTSLYTGVNKGSDFPNSYADETQHQFIANALEQSTADYIIVAGHYPVYRYAPSQWQ